ncbi:MAG TPA: CheR family methyltransferase [Thermoanaerobaculia bacterium]|nr:CheR family methyltransferase [Thermoanaerobaculia bacterium]
MTSSPDAGRAAGETAKQFLVVGIGGSAGAITSFRDFFRSVAPDSGMAYVVILHLSPDHESRLAEVLQTSSPIPVTQVRDAVHVKPDHVYVIPPNKSLAMNDGTLVLSNITSDEERRAPIDIFFRTLATHHDSRAVCVVMSGSGSDGSMGLRRVKEYHGLVLVQDPSEAAFSEMPRNCIATGLVDFVVPAAEMPRRIAHYREQLRTIEVAEEGAGQSSEEETLMELFSVLRLRTGHDFVNYKRPTVLRRIERRMAIRDIRTLPEYVAFLRERHDEAHALLNELLISVTNFFRDRDVWDKVERNVIPQLLAPKRNDDHVRVWVPGCATGEEAYTIAMLLAEKAPPNVQIFATDLDEHAIVRARDGWYSDTEVADVSPERLRRFFIKDGEGYRIRRELRELVLFARHNLLKDPPFSHLDFISCRNVLIYFNRAAQQRALEVMHFGLNVGGSLLLGTAEAIDGSPTLFSVVDKEAHIYQARPATRVPVLPPLPRQATPVDARTMIGAAESPAADSRSKTRFAPIDLHHRLLEQYAPPSLVVDEEYDVVHLSERAGRYLQVPRGESTANVLQLVRPELRIDLRAALLQAAEKRATVAARGLTVQTGELAERIDLVVHPALAEEAARGLFLIVFEEAEERAARSSHNATPVAPGALRLEEELMRVRTQMRATIEQYEVQAEEAKAANEELQAMNEELRSTAEELETSQEELQSVNEELQTVNQQLKVKIDEISHASDDLRNLISSTDIGTIFVDRSLCVKLFTPRARQVFNLIPADVGRPLSDITNRLVADGFADDMTRVLERLQTVEREVRTPDGSWYLMRLLPYRTADDRIDGVVLTFVEITERHKTEEALRDSETRFRALTQASADALYGMSPDWTEMRQLSGGGFLADVVRSANWMQEYIAPQDHERLQAAIAAAIAERKALKVDLRVRRIGGSIGWASWRAVPIVGADGEIADWFGAVTDITERREAVERLRRAAALDAFRVQLNDAITAESDTKGIRAAAARVANESLQADRVRYVEMTADGEIPAHAEAEFPANFLRSRAQRLASGEALRIDDVNADATLTAEEKAAFQRLHARSLVVVPLIKRDQWVAMAYVQHGTPRDWTDDEIDRVCETAERTWVAMERARAEEALRESEEKFRKLFNSMDEGYILADVLFDEHDRPYDVRYIEANRAAVRMAGTELVGRTAREVAPDFGADWVETSGRVARTGVAERRESFAKALNVYYNFYIFKVGSTDSPRVAAIYEDVTTRKQAVDALRESETRLQAIANLVPDLLWMTDAKGGTIWLNERWLHYTGQTAEKAAGWGWMEAVHPDDRARLAENYRSAVEAGRPLQQEHRIRGVSGEYRWFLVNALPVLDEQGKVIRYYGAATDVDEQRTARELLEQRVRERTQALLELSVDRQQLLERLVTAAEEVRKRIARELHDEMGQHITALRVRLESLRPNDRVDDLKAIITHIDQSIDRMTLELRPPALDQLGLHGAITSLAAEFSTASGIRISLHLGLAETDRFSDAIETALYRVLQESLTNIWKHAAAKTVSVILERDREALRLIVEDDGRGFDAEGTSADGVRGRFGLLGMRERLALVGGTFKIESEPGSGAAIYVRVPLAVPESTA